MDVRALGKSVLTEHLAYILAGAGGLLFTFLRTRAAIMAWPDILLFASGAAALTYVVYTAARLNRHLSAQAPLTADNVESAILGWIHKHGIMNQRVEEPSSYFHHVIRPDGGVGIHIFRNRHEAAQNRIQFGIAVNPPPQEHARYEALSSDAQQDLLRAMRVEFMRNRVEYKMLQPPASPMAVEFWRSVSLAVLNEETFMQSIMDISAVHALVADVVQARTRGGSALPL